MMNILFAVLLFHLAELERYANLSFEEVQKAPFLHQEVEVRGYLRQNGEGEWFLTTDPGARSCCVGKKERKHHELFLAEGFQGEKSYHPVLVKGRVTFHPTEEHVYILQGAIQKEARGSSSIWFWVILGVCLAGITVGYLMRRSRCN